jgi:uncharacterized cupredoxin-like copper-binding protein
MTLERLRVFAAAAAIIVFAANPAGAAGLHGQSEKSAMSFGMPGKASEVTRTVKVEAGDMAFHLKALRIGEGETIRFVVTNTDEIDHDFTIGPAAMQAKHRAEMMEMMGDGGAMAKMHEDANAVYLKPGETKELIWTFGNVAELEYACNVPGHYESGMHGELRVLPRKKHGHDDSS